MSLLDWAILSGMMIVLVVMVVRTRRYSRSVADFLAANRTGGRYLLCVSDGMAGLGAITLIAMFEMHYTSGFTVVWWNMIYVLVIPTVLSLSGWVMYRFRQTRALTMGQFFEIRYSRRIRIFASILAWLSGVVNFGIFPAVGTRFFMNFLGLGDSIWIFMLIMAVLLSIALLLTFVGGQISVMVTDFVQGIFCNVMFVITIAVVLSIFRWDQIAEALSRVPDKASMVHPFRIGEAQDLNIGFYLMMAFLATYGYMAWQGNSGYAAAALNPHEARMGRILGTWRNLILNLFSLVLPICAFTFMNHPDFAVESQATRDIIAGIADPTMQKQAIVTVAMRYFLPIGVLGGVCGIFFAAFVGNHDTYLHSWGSIFIQDIVLPLRQKTLTTQQHIKLLRLSIIGVACFIFCFSLFFRQTEYIIMFFAITGAIFLGGAGSIIIGGLYWKRGTAAGAWAGMITGSSLSLGLIVLRQIHLYSPFEHKLLAYICSQNGTVLSFWSALAAIAMYVLFSLLGKRNEFNMDKMLHRGAYAIADDKTAVSPVPTGRLARLMGIGEDFNRRDKIVYVCTILWTVLWVVTFSLVTIYNLMTEVKTESWLTFWKFYVWLILAIGAFVTVWFTIGGVIDLKKMYRRLRVSAENPDDDGSVLKQDK